MACMPEPAKTFGFRQAGRPILTHGHNDAIPRFQVSRPKMMSLFVLSDSSDAIMR